LFLPDKLWQTEPRHNNFSIRWLSYLISSDDYRLKISSHATGTSMSMKNISKVDLLNIEIIIPPLLEQCKIAEILGVWDESIDLLERLIGKTRSRKQGLMQQLLTGKKRFKEFEGSDWKEYSIKDLCKVGRGRVISRVEIENNLGSYNDRTNPPSPPITAACFRYDDNRDRNVYWGLGGFKIDRNVAGGVGRVRSRFLEFSDVY
jgi:restriction endonuclease S subunit